MIIPDTSTQQLKFMKRALLSHLTSVSQLIQTPIGKHITGIDLNQEYTTTTNLIDDVDILLNRRKYEE